MNVRIQCNGAPEKYILRNEIPVIFKKIIWGITNFEKIINTFRNYQYFFLFD